jgi:hypothetical protein
MTEEYREVKSAVDNILKINSVLRRKKKTESDKKRELFVQIINNIESTNIRSTLVYTDFSLDFQKYDELFYEIIDSLIYIGFGKDCSDLISFYLWDRINTDNTINPVIDDLGNEIFIENAYELWDLITKINSKINE